MKGAGEVSRRRDFADFYVALFQQPGKGDFLSSLLIDKMLIPSRPSSQKAAILSLIVLVLIWGYNWVVMKVALRYSSSSDFAALRILVGLMGLLVVFISSRKPLLPRKEVFGIFLTGVQLGEAPTLLEALGMMLIIGALVLNSTQAIKTPRT